MSVVGQLRDVMWIVRDVAQEFAWPTRLPLNEQVPMTRCGKRRLRHVIEDARYTWCSAQVAVLSPSGNGQLCSDCIELLDTNEDAKWNWGQPDHFKHVCRLCNKLQNTWPVDISQMDLQIQEAFHEA